MSVRIGFSSLAFLMVSLVGAADEPKPVEVGDKAPDFVATGIDGKEFRLSEQLRSGESNVVLLFSRAHW